MVANNDAIALHDFAAGMSLQDVRDAHSYRSTTSALAAIQRALKIELDGRDPDTSRKLEIQRLDDMYRVVRPLADAGDLNAVKQAIDIGERRLRLVDAPKRTAKGLVVAYERTVRQLKADGVISAADDAAVQSGRMIAAQIDYAVVNCSGQEVTKALYLMPHLMNVLNELGATPEARRRIKEAAGDTKDAPTDPLEAFRLKQFTAERTA